MTDHYYSARAEFEEARLWAAQGGVGQDHVDWTRQQYDEAYHQWENVRW